ncbi:MAG: DNA polymerase III subunit beta [Paludibacteraceae bacterium]|jgi:DNA polymerase-3 subunit beta|nr:DNA polymerase III subunit beta [Paludibacteraceae bacterium]MDI9536390.1 DNA polymerase III subunit beta [Bacteroidota bacterium]HHT61625.1 DNA polymerase III subunit beta [Bacteroidales bacterium]MBP9038869.1 DNA polymerase III subunit beta [Paludibacteraceae bacterium]HOA45867.1 DNA polymerase III subunit beta [Paludibacteraceae bacterium]
MNFTVSSTALLNRLQIIGKTINPKSPLPILENFLLKLEGDTLTITASDLETTLTTSIPVVDASGEITVAISAKFLMDTLREFAEQPLKFEINPENLAIVIKTEYGNYNFIGQKGDEFPAMPELEDEFNTITVSAESLMSGINKTSFATADDDLRPAMTGIFFDIKPDNLTYVATDAHKLVRLISKTANETEEASFVLPKKPANILRNVIVKENNDVEISFDKKNIIFKLSEYLMICRQIEARFPNYNGVIPQNNPFKLIVDRVVMLNALRRVSVFSNQGTGLVKLSIKTNEILLSAQDIDFSISAEEKIACQYEGENINIGFKAPFLIDILNNISSSDIIIELADPSRAGVILPLENEPNEELLTLIMPMLIND